MNDETNPRALKDILLKVREGIEHVEQTGESFDIEMTAEEYQAYKTSLGEVSSPKNKDILPPVTPKDIPVETAPVSLKETVVKNKTLQVKAGENMYTILVREFDLIHKIPVLGARYNALENILSIIKTSPTVYGITSGDVSKPNVGDSIQIDKISSIIYETMVANKNIIDHANSLPKEVLTGIEEYMPEDAKNALTSIEKLHSEKIIPILEDPTGAHTLISGHDELLITDGKSHQENIQTSKQFQMTEVESKEVLASLTSEMTLQKIPWASLLAVGAENALLFMTEENKTPINERISNVLKIHQVKTELSVRNSSTVLEYLQETTLLLMRKAAQKNT